MMVVTRVLEAITGLMLRLIVYRFDDQRGHLGAVAGEWLVFRWRQSEAPDYGIRIPEAPKWERRHPSSDGEIGSARPDSGI